MDHAFNTNIASKYDVNIAILLHNFKFWTLNNLANNRNIYDGLCWSYDTLEALSDIFPYWSRRQLERIIANAVDSGLLKKGNFNQTKYDRTVWYALTPMAYGFYPELLKEKYLESLYLCISPNGEMDFTEWRNRFPQTVTPIPDTNPDTKPNINTIGTSDEDAFFGTKSYEITKSDLNHNQTEEKENTMKGLEEPESSAKSDYHNNQTKKRSLLKKTEQFVIKDILQSNEFQIPEQIIQDWITNRKKKNTPLTKTAWNKINKELTKCKEKGIDPTEAFETMVASGWQSLKAEYFESQKKTPTLSQWDVESVMRA